MKVITQLIQHFWQREALNPEQAAYLVRQGFVRAADLPGFAWAEPAEEAAPAPPPVAVGPAGPLEQLEEELVGRALAPKRGRGKVKGKALTEAELTAAVEGVLEARAAELEAFRAFAARFGAADTWVEAAVAARQAPDDRFAAELAKALRPKAATLRALWDALDVEPLHAVVDDPALHGPVVRAYRLLLTAERALPGRHGFLLKRPALQAVRSLAPAHRKLRAALVRLTERHATVLAAALRHGGHPVVFWALALVYNARRAPLGGPGRPDREYGPLPLPAAAVWRQAWTAALGMDAAAVTRLLAACYADAEGRTKREPLQCGFPFHCPRTWRAPAGVA